MESLPTILDLLTADLLIPLLPSLVTMATLSLEGVKEIVRMMGPGVEQLQPVKVSFNSCFTFIDTVNTVPTEPPTNCPDLTVPANVMISYNMGTTSLRPVNTLATYTCDTGYNGRDTTRTCGSDGVWSGDDPTCSELWYGCYGELF